MKLTFNLPSNPGCAPLVCGKDNNVFVRLKDEHKAKSTDGTGYLKGIIDVVEKVTVTSWRYTVEIDETVEVYPGETVLPQDVMPTLCCISCADEAILAKLALGGGGGGPAPVVNTTSWQAIALFPPDIGVSAGTQYLLRRFRTFRIQSVEAAIASGGGPVDVQLQISGPDNNIFTNIGSLMTIAAPALTTSFVPGAPITVPAKCALRALISHGGIYPVAFGLEIHLLTTEVT